MDHNCIIIIELIIDAISNILVPILVPFIIFILSRKPAKKLFNLRLGEIEKKLREHIRGCTDEEQLFMNKTLNEVFSKPSMRW
ncbi:MAG: hypothetical protein FWD47_09285 [Treponema sp.]|nr:hypothetical protein [Treponema sp.]